MSQEALNSVPCFESIDALREGLAAKSVFEAIDLYPRDGSIKLCEAEEQVGNLARTTGRETVLFASGMTAVTNSIEVALQSCDSEEPVLAAGQQQYSQTGNFLQNYLPKRGVRVVRFDSGSPVHIKHVVERLNPDVIFSETVANGSDIPVLDVDNLLDTVSAQKKEPIVVLDNTLPLATGLPLGEKLKPEDNAIIVESATKSYTFNNELLGIAYSKSPELVEELRRYRRTAGTMPGLAGVERILSLIPESTEAFDERNLKLFHNAGRLARRLYEAQQAGGDFIVSHPTLPTHDNQELAKGLPDGGSPVLFLQCISCADQFDLAARLWDNPAVRDNADVGQSFGFDRARILPDESSRVVRISAGAYTDCDALGDALYEASLKKA